MGRGRTTTGMVTACLIATTLSWKKELPDETNGNGDGENESDGDLDQYDSIDGPSEEEAYLQGRLCTVKWRLDPLIMAFYFRRIQDHSAARWRTIPWEAGEASDRPCYRRHARCTEPSKGHLRVSSSALCDKTFY